MSRFSPRRLLLAAALALSGCSQQALHRDLTEDQANAIVAALAQDGIGSNKIDGEEGAWTVEVADGDFARAVSTLREHGLPGETFQSLGEVFAKEGFTSTPLEQRARLIYGLSQELAQTVSSIDGVVQARVHLTMPEDDPLAREAVQSSASVFVKYRPGFSVENQTGAIKTLVANSIEGISYNRVSVVMVPAAASPAPPVSDAWEGSETLRYAALALAILLVMVGGWRMMVAGRRKPSPPEDPSARTVLGRGDA